MLGITQQLTILSSNSYLHLNLSKQELLTTKDFQDQLLYWDALIFWINLVGHQMTHLLKVPKILVKYVHWSMFYRLLDTGKEYFLQEPISHKWIDQFAIYLDLEWQFAKVLFNREFLHILLIFLQLQFLPLILYLLKISSNKMKDALLSIQLRCFLWFPLFYLLPNTLFSSFCPRHTF